MPTYVKLNRQLGSQKELRFDDPAEWEMIEPIRNPDNTFSAPKEVKNRLFSSFYMKYLLAGEIILVAANGIGWNTLLKSDKILSIRKK